MPVLNRRAARGDVALLGLTALARPAIAQNGFPALPLRLLVPFAPGGSTDIIARLMSEQMRQQLGLPAVVENSPDAKNFPHHGVRLDARRTGDGVLHSA